MISKILPSPFKLNHLLQACSTSKSLHQGKQIHQQIILNGLHYNPFFTTKLIQMYADCDDLHSAKFLLHKLMHPNVFAWTSVLGFYSRHDFSEECIRIYCELKLKGVTPDGYVFPKVLRACAQSLRLDVGLLVHKDAVVFGSESNIQVCNSMMDMYSKCGDIRSARKVFDEMAERDVSSWNSMISGYVSNRFLEGALELFGFLRKDGCEPDIVTWNTVMNTYCQMGLYNDASNIFVQIKDPNIISWTTFMSGYSKIGKHDIALGILRDMVNRGMVSLDVGALSNILVSCRCLFALKSGREVHGYGVKSMHGNIFYKSAGAALLTMYASCNRLHDAENVFLALDKSDVVTWNAMIFGYIDLHQGHLALGCFTEMQRRGVEYDHTTISTILPVCDLRSGKQIHAHLKKKTINIVVPVYNALIHMYSIGGCIAYAYSVFSTMVSRDLISWNTMIRGFGMHGLGKAALKILQEMNDSGLSPDSVTFSAALSACSHAGLVDEGTELFYSMTKDFGLTPGMEHYSCVVDMVARAGRLEDAFNFIKSVPVVPDKHIWGALLAACQEHQNVSIGKVAAEHLIHLEPHDAGHYVTLSNICARAGQWHDALRIRELMENKASMKPSGLSLIGSGS